MHSRTIGAEAQNGNKPESALCGALQVTGSNAYHAKVAADRLESLLERLSGPGPAVVTSEEPSDPPGTPHMRLLERTNAAQQAALGRIEAAIGKLETLIG